MPLSPIPLPSSTSEWTSCYLPALVGRHDAVLRQVRSLEQRVPTRSGLPALGWATRALWVLDHPAHAARLLEACLQVGGPIAAELGTFGRPAEGPGYAYIRLALAENPTSVCEARCDLAVLALQQGDVSRAHKHICDARQANPAHQEALRWQRLLQNHALSVLGWRHGEAPASAIAACMLLDLWPDASNGFLSPCRFRRVRSHTPC